MRRYHKDKIIIVSTRGAPDMQFSNPAGTGFTGIGQKCRPVFRPDMPELGIIWDELFFFKMATIFFQYCLKVKKLFFV